MDELYDMIENFSMKRLKNFQKFSHQRLQTETRTKNGRKRSEKAEGSAG